MFGMTLGIAIGASLTCGIGEDEDTGIDDETKMEDAKTSCAAREASSEISLASSNAVSDEELAVSSSDNSVVYALAVFSSFSAVRTARTVLPSACKRLSVSVDVESAAAYRRAVFAIRSGCRLPAS